MRKAFITSILSMGFFARLFGSNKTEDFPPVPEWEPRIEMPIAAVAERFRYYTDGKRDFVVFAHGTCAVVPDGLTDEDAKKAACSVLAAIFGYHPDMNPMPMDDGNILVRYNHPAYNVVLMEVVEENWDEIKKRHLTALAKDEVIMTSQGPNKFDEFGIKALFGRCYFFMDAKDPKPVRVERKGSDSEGDGTNSGERSR